jgi:hypothetical protein
VVNQGDRMTPDMSEDAMLNQFIFIVKGSRVIDRTERNWGPLMWLDEKLVKHHVYNLAEMRAYFQHRVRKHTSLGARIKVDPFGSWLSSPNRFICQTLTEAMQLADQAARGLLEPRICIDIDAMVRKANAPSWVRAMR